MSAPQQQRDADGEVPRRKQLRINQDLIDEAQRILGTRTSSETIERALDLIISPEKELEAFRRTRADVPPPQGPGQGAG